MIETSFDKSLGVTLIFFWICSQTQLSTSSTNEDFNCTFDTGLCGWQNELGGDFINWTRIQGSTPSNLTGLKLGNNSAGAGFYIHMNASRPRKLGTKARFTSSRMNIPGCMTFMYQLFGDEAGSVIVYLMTRDGTLQPMWIQSRNQGDEWAVANVYLNRTDQYQVVVDGIRGSSSEDEIAIDEIIFHEGPCQNSAVQRFLVYAKQSETSEEFQVDTRARGDGWSYQFAFEATQTSKQEYTNMYFVYETTAKFPRSLSQVLSVNETGYRPISFFFSRTNGSEGLTEIRLQDHGRGTSLVLLLEQDFKCCGLQDVGLIYVNVTEDEASPCPPGWYLVQNTCYLINMSPSKTWIEAYHTQCPKNGGKLAVAFNNQTLRKLETVIQMFGLVKHFFLVAAWSTGTVWKWIDDVIIDSSDSRWGPGRPRWIGRCAGWMFFDGIGWRLRDERCADQLPYICEKNAGINSSCPRKWNRTRNLCFYNSGSHELQWDEASKDCQKMGGYLTVLSSQVKIDQLSEMLNNSSNHQPHKNKRFFIGLRIDETWYWDSGQLVAPFSRGEGFPDEIGGCGSLLVTTSGLRFADVGCTTKYGYICERKKAINIAYKQSAVQFPVSHGGSPGLAVDGKVTTCAQIESRSSNSWWSVDLNKDAIITTVVISIRPNCCLENVLGNLSVTLTSESGENTTCGPPSSHGNALEVSVSCRQPAVGRYVIIRDLTGNQTMVLCEVAVYTTDGNCSFDDFNFCEWRNDVESDDFDWRIRWDGTPSALTGPNTVETDHGYFIYIETSEPQKTNDKARLISPWMIGANCLLFDYHMNGETIGILIVYTRTDNNETAPVWIKNGNKGDKWFTAHVSLYNKKPYQVIIEGRKGSSYTGDAALDQLRVHEGLCTNTDPVELHVYSRDNMRAYQVDYWPTHSSWEYQFSFEAPQAMRSLPSVLFFVYDVLGERRKPISHELDLSDDIPFAFFYGHKSRVEGDSPIHIVDSGPGSYQKLILNDSVLCCGEEKVESFFLKVSVKEQSGCEPGWLQGGTTCYLVNIMDIMPWTEARVECSKLGGELAVVDTPAKVGNLSEILGRFTNTQRVFSVGLTSALGPWRWINGRPLGNISLWGVGEPSGDGMCLDLLHGESWNPAWKGLGWRWNDDNCNLNCGRICEKKVDSDGCASGWHQINDSCFHFTIKDRQPWVISRTLCQGIGGDLAIVDNEPLRKQISDLLDKETFGNYDLKHMFIGSSARVFREWSWTNGHRFNKSLWGPNQPRMYGECGVMLPTNNRWSFGDASCQAATGFICEKKEVSMSSGGHSSSSHSVELGAQHSWLAVDGIYRTCFVLKQETNAWWRIDLETEKFIYKIRVTNRMDCCSQKQSHFEITVGTDSLSRDPDNVQRCGKLVDLPARGSRTIVCEPPVLGRYVKVVVPGGNTSLTLCEVSVYGSGNNSFVNGVLRETWFDISGTSLANLKSHDSFPSNPDGVTTIADFDSPVNFANNYGQRLSAYIQLPDDGNYTFYLTCDEVCELWLRESPAIEVHSGIKYDNEESARKTMLAQILEGYQTKRSEWEKYPSLQTSQEITLNRCNLYFLEAFMKEGTGNDSLAVGVKFPDGRKERPIKGSHLYWTVPGVRRLTFNLVLDHYSQGAKVGEELGLSASYEFCCRGPYCPNCSLRLNLYALGQVIQVSQSLKADCHVRTFNQSLLVIAQPGQYDIEIGYTLRESLQIHEVRKKVQEIKVAAVVLDKCGFQKTTCFWKLNPSLHGWKISSDGDQHVFVDDRVVAYLERDWTSSVNFYATTGLCLRFQFMLPSKSGSKLSVYLDDLANQTLIWSLSGFHGSNWMTGQVSWRSSTVKKITFQGDGRMNRTMTVALTDIQVSTETCRVAPEHATPGYTCPSADLFQCVNKACIKEGLVCNGDEDCLDGSDENNCKCILNEFTCLSGECVSVEKLCDHNKDCEDGSDELRCESGCSNHFSCSDGSCVPWKFTCDGRKNCEDGSDEPFLCRAQRCSMNNMGCRAISNRTRGEKSCSEFRGRCLTENSWCGFQPGNGDLQWLTGSGETPTKETGASYDHTFYSRDGQYFYIEASGQRRQDSARIISDWIESDEDRCLYLWYFMYGDDVGSLNVYRVFNGPENVLWRKAGNQGSRWKFAQVPLGKSVPYKVVVEGVVGGGKRSDIAIDDLTVLEESCTTDHLHGSMQTTALAFICVHRRKGLTETPHCYFDDGFCSWSLEEDWKLSKEFPPPFVETRGGSEFREGFVYLHYNKKEDEDQWSSLIGPLLSRASDQWKCIKLWIFVGASYTGKVGELTVSVLNANSSMQLIVRFAEKTNEWTYVQLPLPNGTTKVVIKGRKTHSDQIIAVDDISFSPYTCDGIPWKKQEPNYVPLNWTNVGDGIRWKASRQIELDLNVFSNVFHEKDLEDYEIHLKAYKGGYLRARLGRGLKELSVCLWLKRDNVSYYCTPFFYGSVSKGSKITGVRLSGCYRLNIAIMGQEIFTNIAINGGEWQFLCISWRSQGGLFKVYQNGKLRLAGKGFKPGELIPGSGEFTVGPDYDGKISAVNVWDKVLTSSDVYWMSVGCSKAVRNPVIDWEKFLSDSIGNVTIVRQASCKAYKGTRLIALRDFSDHMNQTALYTSPQYERSGQHYGKCLRFRYTLHGETARLQLLQLTNHSKGEKRLIWTDTVYDTVVREWNYGQVSMATTTSHQLFLSGQFGELSGYIAIAGMHVVPGYCSEFTEQAKQACNISLTHPRGRISSPHYPGYYSNNALCHWRITAPAGHVIRLAFTMFELEDREACDRDFLEIRDGPSTRSPPIGRFCGHSYPPVIKSTNEHLFVTFSTNEVKVRNGFEAWYTFEPAQTKRNRSCVRLEGCPLNCDCFVTAQSKLVVQGRCLSVVPQQFPTLTSVLLLSRNRISHIPETAFSKITAVEYIDLSENIIKSLASGSFNGLRALKTLRLKLNFLKELPAGLFSELGNLELLDLSQNLLHKVERGFLKGLKSLQVLSLHSNKIDTIDHLGFIDAENITFLYLQHNFISSIPDSLFSKMSKLQTIHLNKNNIRRLSSLSFDGLGSLKTLFLQDNVLTDVEESTFSKLQDLRHLRLDHYIWCCFAEKAIDATEFKCISPANEFSSCDDLMKNRTLRIFIWFLGLLALFGNILVIVLRLLVKEGNKVHTLLLTNLAVADMLMGAYLLVVAVKDLQWQGEYFKHDMGWRSGYLCQFAGALSMVSSESSVLLLTFITLDRLVCIVFPFRFGRISRKTAIIGVSIIWIFSIAIALTPSLDLTDYFNDGRWDIGFYGRSSICLPLQLSSEKIAGWEYSVVIFIALNFASFMFILFAYIAMFLAVRKMTRSVRSTHMSRESAMAKRMVFIIMTDLCCWMPIIVIGILSLTGSFHDPGKQVYVWLAVFVLPLNSSINPVLYTFSTPRIRRKLLGMTSGVSSAEQPGDKLGTRKTLSDQNKLTPRKKRFKIFKGKSADQVSASRNIRVVQVYSVFHEDTVLDVIYLTAEENTKESSTRLLKCYPNTAEQEWNRELEIARRLRQNGNHPNIMRYQWHSSVSSTTIKYGTIKVPTLKKNSLLICYDHISDTNLDSFLGNDARMLIYDVLVTIAMDIISAIEFLVKCGVAHNNISPSTVLIKRSIHIPPIVAVLGGFTAAVAIEEEYKDTEEAHGLFRNDIRQFGQLLATLLGHCNGSSEYTELQAIMNSCFGEDVPRRMNASDIKKSLEDLWYDNETWDTAI